MTLCLQETFVLTTGQGMIGEINAPNQTYWGAMEAPIISTLGLQLSIKEFNPPIDAGLANSMVEAITARRPWLGALYSPSPMFSPLTGVKLTEMALPKWSEACEQESIDSGGTVSRCGYSETFVKRYVSTTLANQSYPAYQFLTSVTFAEQDMNEILGEIYWHNMSTTAAACKWLKSNVEKWQPLLPNIYYSPPTCAIGKQATKTKTYWTCETCPTGTFSLVAGAPCTACPYGATCPGDGSMLVQRGYWFDNSSGLVDPQVYACPSGSGACCPGGTCGLITQCAADRTGNMCNTCARPGHYQWNGKCADCSLPSSATATGLLSVPAICVLVAVGVFIVLRQSGESLFVADLLLFYQLSAFVVRSDDGARVLVLKLATLDMSSWFDGVVPSNVCIAPLTNLGRVVIKALFPYAFWIMLGVYHLMAVACAWACRRFVLRAPPLTATVALSSPTTPTTAVESSKSPSLLLNDAIIGKRGDASDRGGTVLSTRRKNLGAKLMRAAKSFAKADLTHFFIIRYCVMFNMTFMPLVEGALKLVNCRSVGTRGMFLSEAPDVPCYDRWHMPAFVYGVTILGVLMVVLPVLVTRRLREIFSTGRDQDQATYHTYGVFYGSYKRSHFYYGIADQVKRAVVVILSVMISRQSEGALLVNMIIIVAALWIFLLELPVTHPESQWLDEIRLSALGVILCAPCLLAPWYAFWRMLVTYNRTLMDQALQDQKKKIKARVGESRQGSRSEEIRRKLSTASTAASGSIKSMAAVLSPSHHMTVPRMKRILAWYRVLGADDDLVGAEDFMRMSQASMDEREVGVGKSTISPLLLTSMLGVPSSSPIPSTAGPATTTTVVVTKAVASLLPADGADRPPGSATAISSVLTPTPSPEDPTREQLPPRRPSTRNIHFLSTADDRRASSTGSKCELLAPASDVARSDNTKYITCESIIQIDATIDTVPEPVQSCTVSTAELKVHQVFIESAAPERLPFTQDDASRPETDFENTDEQYSRVTLPIRLDNRVIDLRTPTNQAIFRIQSGVCQLFREFLYARRFTEIHTPKLLGAASEGGANFFEVSYFKTKAYLAQSPQLYKQMMVCGDFERVFEIGPVFRAENSNSHRHMTEFTGLDMEMSFNEHYHEVLDVLGELFTFIFEGLESRYTKELEVVGRQYPYEAFQFLQKPLRLEFAQGVAMLREAGYEMGDEEDLNTEKERALGKLVKDKYKTDFFILDKFPLAVRPFYTMPDPNNKMYSNSYDFFIRGEEIMSGAQRIHDPEMLLASAQAHGVDPVTIQGYLDSFKYGVSPHAGGGVGLERVVMLYLNLGNIRRTALFPRDPTRLEP
ncbi:hypothetical protein BC828DRAFT_400042 [Blastocladiella britannica]|nr:hypothetical protein BC828DRAFT_400042 [Blastocladiella britannica]